MIEQADTKIASWIKTVLGTVDIDFSAPRDSMQGKGVNAYLMALDHTPPPTRSKVLPPLVIRLQYLITTFAPDVQTSHRMLSELITNALLTMRYETKIVPQESAIWRAFGVVPKPCFMIHMPHSIERPIQTAKPVTKLPVIEKVAIMRLTGNVIGPNDIPIAGATVEVIPQGPVTHSDYCGHFQLAPLPGGLGYHQLLIKAKGIEQRIKVAKESDGKPLIVRFKSLEG